MPQKINVKVLTTAAMLASMSILIGIFCKNYMNFGRGLFRITLENLPIILTGILFGPIVGGIVGCATDLISYMLSTQVFGINFVVTFGAIMIGVISGGISRFIVKKHGYLQIILSCIFSHIIGSMIIKSAGLYMFYGTAVLWRIPLYIAISTVEATILCLLYRNNNFKKLIDGKWFFGR